MEGRSRTALLERRDCQSGEELRQQGDMQPSFFALDLWRNAVGEADGKPADVPPADVDWIAVQCVERDLLPSEKERTVLKQAGFPMGVLFKIDSCLMVENTDKLEDKPELRAAVERLIAQRRGATAASA